MSYWDIRAAYRELGLDAQAQLEDDIILGTFHSRIADAPKHEAEVRRALKVIGQDRVLLPKVAVFEKAGITTDLDHVEWDLVEAPGSKEEVALVENKGITPSRVRRKKRKSYVEMILWRGTIEARSPGSAEQEQQDACEMLSLRFPRSTIWAPLAARLSQERKHICSRTRSI